MKQLKTLIIAFSTIVLCSCQTMTALQDDVSDIKSGNFDLTAPITGHNSEAILKSHCPQVQIVDDLSSISDFSDPKKSYKEHLISRVDIKSAESTCKTASKSVTMDLKLIFNGTLGAKGRKSATDKPFFSYPYFIAVLAPNGKIMAKEIFAASITYAPNETTHSYFEKLRQIIPIDKKSKAHLYKILIGFQITPDQLEHNRDNMIELQK